MGKKKKATNPLPTMSPRSSLSYLLSPSYGYADP
jgi:hypothetical protein